MMLLLDMKLKLKEKLKKCRQLLCLIYPQTIQIQNEPLFPQLSIRRFFRGERAEDPIHIQTK